MTVRYSDDDLECVPVTPDRWPAAVLLAVWALIWAVMVWGFGQEPFASAFAAYLATLIAGLPVVLLIAGAIRATEGLAESGNALTSWCTDRARTRSSR